MAPGGVRRRWSAAALAAAALAAAPGARPQDAAATTLVDERFDRPGLVPAFATYEKPPAELQAQLERGAPWHLIVEPGSAATAEVADGAATVHIRHAGPHWYAVQLAYLPLRIQPRRAYRVTFRARADRGALTTFDLAHVGDGWHSYSGKKELRLGPAWTELEVRFRTAARESDAAARFEFNFGDLEDVAVSIDDVRIVEDAIAD